MKKLDRGVRRMIDSTITEGVVPFAGSDLCGFVMGWVLRRLIKWLLITVGVVLGVIFLALEWLQKSGYINGTIQWEKLGNDISSYGQHLATQIDFTNLHGVFGTLGIPVGSGLGLGLLAGFLKR
jgi:uncharacterized membrane protein (Fun14 family)